MADANPVLARTTRSGVLESLHRGRLVITDPDGGIECALGDIEEVTYPRSATKVFQAIAMLESGYDLVGPLLALAEASHSGEGVHLAGVRAILEAGGLTEHELQNTPDFPIDEQARVEWIAGGGHKASVTQNCSGKHAAMLVTCVRAGWPIDTYLDPAHPLQERVTEVVERYTGVRPDVGVDGCGAPAHTMSVRALARAFGQIAASREGAERAAAQAFREFPEYVSGTRRWESRLHRAVPGLICKYGAEATFAIGLPNGQGIAFRMDDGGERALPVIAVEALGLLGIRSEELTQIGSVPVLGGGRPVGEIASDLAGELA